MIQILLLGFLSQTGCLPVETDRITAKDFARAVPEFGALPEGVSLGFSPLPGAHRGFSGVDVQRIAAQYGIKTDFHDAVCFEWPMKRLERSAVLKAMREGLGQDGTELEEYSLFPAPEGKIFFPLAGLNRQPKGSSFWRGYVLYDGDKHFNIWAKVRLDPELVTSSKAEVVSGSRVNVLVRCGATELKLEAQAITSGAKGQTVTLRNPSSGRSFAGEVVGKDSVLVEVGGTRE